MDRGGSFDILIQLIPFLFSIPLWALFYYGIYRLIKRAIRKGILEAKMEIRELATRNNPYYNQNQPEKYR